MKTERRPRMASLWLGLVLAFVAQEGVSLGAPPVAPAGWLSGVQAGIAASEYEISWQEAPAALPGRSANTVESAAPRAGWQAPNRAQNLRMHFTEAGIR